MVTKLELRKEQSWKEIFQGFDPLKFNESQYQLITNAIISIFTCTLELNSKLEEIYRQEPYTLGLFKQAIKHKSIIAGNQIFF